MQISPEAYNLNTLQNDIPTPNHNVVSKEDYMDIIMPLSESDEEDESKEDSELNKEINKLKNLSLNDISLNKASSSDSKEEYMDIIMPLSESEENKRLNLKKRINLKKRTKWRKIINLKKIHIEREIMY